MGEGGRKRSVRPRLISARAWQHRSASSLFRREFDHGDIGSDVDGAHVDVCNAAALDWREYYGANCEWLRRVRVRYDPHKVFSFEQSLSLSRESTV
ncbi:BBE domain-containing protein [Nocardia sp. CA-135953]|uniref:BBE domain-containing protein n=1 Tax=Nocardia sp. CA-135953 TaxID=3239978 RepID=UPI003D992E69